MCEKSCCKRFKRNRTPEINNRLIREFKIALTTLFFAMLLVLLPPTADDTDALYSITRGGRLYDNWCKECHAWDYRGVEGAYGSGEHYTGIKGIQGMRDTDPAEATPALLFLELRS
ncbi:MAG: hypothetical protein QGD92_07565 [Gammaproteobacteria bacterium]|nr:hypothetical protein [Gammaproteobacteria bacterium]